MYQHIPIAWAVYYSYLQISVLIGSEDEHWIPVVADVQEYQLPRFGHQN